MTDNELKALGEFLDVIDSGKLNENTLGKFTWGHLRLLLYATIEMEGGAGYYQRIKQYIENMNIGRLRRQEKIVVAIMAYDSSTWIGDELCELLDQSEHFTSYVVLTSVYNGQSDGLRETQYRENLQYFQSRKVKLLPTINPKDGSQYTWEQLGVRPHIYIWLSPYPIWRGDFDLYHVPLDTLHTYIPYGYMITENPEHTFFNAHFNQEAQLLMWKVFYESRVMVRMAEKYCYIGDTAAVYTGYPKMDAFYKPHDPKSSIWNTLMQKGNNAGKKRIIYAPHHTMAEGEGIHFSTFAENYLFMLTLAEKYRDETIWIFRPHPILKDKALRSGLFENEAAWEEYVAQWDAMGNAMSYERGDYADLMMNSDAMMMDCGSFAAEYIYAQKPMLFLDSGKAAFNEFGEEIMQVHYRVSGDDFAAIEDFLVKTVIGGADPKAAFREEYFKKNIDYRAEFGGKSAAQNIFDYLNGKMRRWMRPEDC